MSTVQRTMFSDLGRALFGIFFGASLVVGVYIAASTWERVKTKPPERTLRVTGSAKKRIISDLISWSAEVSVVNTDRRSAYKELAEHIKSVHKYLASHKIPEKDMRIGAVTVSEIWDTETVGSGQDRIQRKIFRGYRLSQAVTVNSFDVELVEAVSRGVTDLLEQGVPVTSSEPQYFYTKLGDLKIEMLAEAAKDARVRAENILEKASGAKIARIRDADMGVINVNPANSTATSWEGNNDTTSLEKDIITIVHVTYELE